MKVHGPYLDKRGKKHRRIVLLTYDDGSKKTQSYARYLLEGHLGRSLEDDEDADHIDGDTLNDDLSNLRPLPAKVNRSLGQQHRTSELYHFLCPVCGAPATKLMRQVRQSWSMGHAGPFCSASCAGRWFYTDQNGQPKHKIECPYGHLKKGQAKGRNGKMYRVCLVCSRDRRRVKRAIQNGKSSRR